MLHPPFPHGQGESHQGCRKAGNCHRNPGVQIGPKEVSHRIVSTYCKGEHKGEEAPNHGGEDSYGVAVELVDPADREENGTYLGNLEGEGGEAHEYGELNKHIAEHGYHEPENHTGSHVQGHLVQGADHDHQAHYGPAGSHDLHIQGDELEEGGAGADDKGVKEPPADDEAESKGGVEEDPGEFPPQGHKAKEENQLGPVVALQFGDSLVDSVDKNEKTRLHGHSPEHGHEGVRPVFHQPLAVVGEVNAVESYVISNCLKYISFRCFHVSLPV